MALQVAIPRGQITIENMAVKKQSVPKVLRLEENQGCT